MMTRASPGGPVTPGAGAGHRAGLAGPVPGPRSMSGTATDAISTTASTAAPGRELCLAAQRRPKASITMMTAQTESASAPPVIRRTASASRTGPNPRRLTHISSAPTVAAAAQSQTRNLKLIQPGEMTSAASNWRNTSKA
jgi:hypothetical protein